MSGMVLVATPARLDTPRVFLARAEELAERLTYAPRQRVLYLNEQQPGGGKYGPNAAARNQLVERFLRPWHEWVLWVDVDILEYPADLIERLMAVANRWDHGQGAIAAPMVWMERVGEGPVGIPTGGWFYDIGGFVGLDGEHADFETGPKGGAEVELASVGCVYLMPAWVFRDGMRYRPRGDEVEHLSLMRAARETGVRVVASRGVEVTHAYLPKYGEGWHHG